MNIISKLVTIVTDPKTIRELLRFRFVGYLRETGWIESLRQRKPVDANGKPLPWMTLPFIHFIEPRLNSSLQMFEFGSGNSTKYFRAKVGSILSVEHDREWFNHLIEETQHIGVLFQPLDSTENYERSAMTSGKKFNLIVVDGRRRVNCIFNSINALTSDGVFILDDSEREEYKEGVDFLLHSGFKKLDFWGIAPGMHARKCTSIFYKTDNCLGI